jgi:Tfp pilus assembly protein PilF
MNHEGQEGHEEVRGRISRRRWLAALALLGALSAGCRNAPPSESARVTVAQRREAAYQANNRGVALMEQDAYAEAARAFREALSTEPGLRLAGINLAIALYYAGQLMEAQQAASDARRGSPAAPQPPYILGLIARAQNQPQAAVDAFMRVLEIDPSDIGSKLNIAMIRLTQGQYQEVVALCRAVLADEPYNATAAYNLALALDRAGDRPASAGAMRQFEQLRNAPYAVTYSQAYLEQGRYAEALASSGIEPDLVDMAAPSVTFTDVTTAWLPDATAARGVMPALADIDGDGRPDLLVSDGTIRAFHNDGTRLVDVTATLGLAARGSTAIVAADVNNDGRVDVLALTVLGPRLLTQGEDGRFRDTTPPVFSNARSTLWAAALADLDHDGDLDVLAGGRLFRNNGNGTFADVTATSRLRLPPAANAIVPTDFDNRRDVDLLASANGTRPLLFRNLRTGSFEDVAASVGLPAATDVTAVATGDVNKDGFTDVFFGRSGAPGVWALSDGRGHFQMRDARGNTAGAQASQLLDYDNDGLLDLVTASGDGLHLIRNRGRDWQEVDQAVAASRHGRIAEGVVPTIASGDIDGDGDVDLVVDDAGSIRIWRNDGGNARRAVRVELTGRASNRNGVGAKVEVRAGSLYTRIETAATSPAVMPADVLMGLGARTNADAVRVLWPSGILQTETPASGNARLAIAELDRKPSSCPFLYTWDGERFTFVTDFMGGGEMGYLESPGVYNVPDPDEYVRITDRQLRERNGRYELRVTNELEEVLYLDQVKLMAVTHYEDVEVFPNEGMRVRPAPFRLRAVRNVRPIAAAADDKGHDLLSNLAALDRKFATGFALEPVRGYAKPHGITLRLPAGIRRAPSAVEGDSGFGIRRGARTVLLLTGWTDYAFSTDNVAATQSALALTPPALEAQNADGTWRTVIGDVGIPVGRPQTIVLDVTDYAARPLRLVTSMRVYWDRIAVADLDEVEPRPVALAARQAELRWRGFSAEVSPDGREPYGYDYARASADGPWKLMPGRYTREGDVRELVEAVDDRFVISRPGDEISLSFDASALPPLAAGMRRTFLLYASGYSKEMDLHSASPDAVAPIPFRAMPHYPYAWPARYPHDADLDRLHTRLVRRALPALLTRPTER